MPLLPLLLTVAAYFAYGSLHDLSSVEYIILLIVMGGLINIVRKDKKEDKWKLRIKCLQLSINNSISKFRATLLGRYMALKQGKANDDRCTFSQKRHPKSAGNLLVK